MKHKRDMATANLGRGKCQKAPDEGNSGSYVNVHFAVLRPKHCTCITDYITVELMLCCFAAITAVPNIQLPKRIVR